MNTLTFKEKKSAQQKLTLVTCYDYTSAKILNSTSVDAILVGDSLAMTMYGENTTLPATVDLMAQHTRAVVRGAPNKFVIGDLPFLSYRMSIDESMNAVLKIMQAGAHAVKLEGVLGNEDLVQHLVESGVPVMGHVGLTPQSVHQFGGFKVQGRSESQQEQLLRGSLELQKRGCFSLVLECVPTSLAGEITRSLEIPTIGIGAGPDTDGQILVWQDLLGMNPDFQPKFVRTYMAGQQLIHGAIESYCQDVRASHFPAVNESFI